MIKVSDGVDGVPVISHMQNAAHAVIEILREHEQCGENMRFDVPFSLFSQTKGMDTDERSEYVFDHIVGAYSVFHPFTDYDYTATLH